MKTINFTTRVRCGASHNWAPRGIPWLMPGSSQDTTILPEFFTAPIRMDFDLRGELGRCPQCGEAASAICFEAMPGEMV